MHGKLPERDFHSGSFPAETFSISSSKNSYERVRLIGFYLQTIHGGMPPHPLKSFSISSFCFVCTQFDHICNGSFYLKEKMRIKIPQCHIVLSTLFSSYFKRTLRVEEKPSRTTLTNTRPEPSRTNILYN
jgi:hypothetical protein